MGQDLTRRRVDIISNQRAGRQAFECANLSEVEHHPDKAEGQDDEGLGEEIPSLTKARIGGTIDPIASRVTKRKRNQNAWTCQGCIGG